MISIQNSFQLQANESKIFTIIAIVANSIFSLIALPLIVVDIYFTVLLSRDMAPFATLLFIFLLVIKYSCFAFQWTILVLFYDSKSIISKNLKTIFYSIFGSVFAIYFLFTLLLIIELIEYKITTIIKVIFNPYIVTYYFFLLSIVCSFLFVLFKPDHKQFIYNAKRTCLSGKNYYLINNP